LVQMEEMGLKCSFETIAITKEQISEYNIPINALKKKDSRSKAFLELNGDMAVELDALDPNVLQTLIKDSVNKYFDNTIYQSVLEIQEEHKAFFQEKLKEFNL